MKEHIKATLYHVLFNLFIFIKWLFLAIVIGVMVGGASTLFAHAMTWAAAFRTENMWMLLTLPLGGLLIAALYKLTSSGNDRGTNTILSRIHSGEAVPAKMAPLIVISTVISHLCGASVGREGAALQLGGSMGSLMGSLLPIDEKDKKTIVMCGMSAAFAALFGTPMAAAIFAIEVVNVGVMYYSALVPCIFSALVASLFAANMGIHPEAFNINAVPELNIISTVQTIVLALVIAVAGIVFCLMLHSASRYFKQFFKNVYVRVVVGSVIIILITILCKSSDYMGAGIEVIERAIEGEAVPYAFIHKMVLTAIAIGCGFKGGEIVPSFFIGATLGCVVGHIIGLEPSTAAAVGMIALFCSVTNCPISSTLIAFELFGYQAVPFFLMGNSISYLMSGYYGLYSEQIISYSKYSLTFEKRNAR